MELYLEIESGIFRNRTGDENMNLCGVRLVRRQDVPVSLSFLGRELEAGRVTLAAYHKRNGQLLAYQEEQITDGAVAMVVDFDTQEIRAAARDAEGKTIEAQVAVLVETEEGKGVYHSLPLNFYLEPGLIGDEHLPNSARPAWEMMYETVVKKAEETEGYAGSALASKRAAAASEAAAGTSATNAARDAKSAHAAKTAVESLATTWPETVREGKQQIIEARNEAVTAIQDKQANSVLAVGRAQKTATDKISGAQADAVSAVQAAGKEAQGTITPLVQRVETAKEAIDQAEGRINTAATDATNSATSAANSATAAANALAAIPQVDAEGNMTLAGGLTANGTVNANGGVNIPLAVGAPTDTAAVNRLYAAGLAAVTDAFSVRCYPLPANCSSSNGTVFKTDKEPNSLYFNVPPNSSFTVKCGLVTNARPMHNYSSIRGWVAPVRLPAVSAKFTARFGQMTTVVRMGRDRDAFTLVPDQAAGGYRIGEIIDITFDHVRDADAGGYHIRVREIYYSNAEQKWKMKTTQALAPETSSNNGYPVCVYAVVYEQYQDGGYDTEDRGALWLLHGGNSSRGCVKIATVKGVHCFESIYPFSGYYLDIENTNSWALAGAFLPATMHLHCNNVNPAYYGFSSMESNIIVSEAVEDFVDPEAETTTED
ncbi:hypothetical protein DMI72_00575 [Akkermansia muciniphila]|nr:hypothetical protein DMI71_00570 [Akkermansia muciniphila]QHV54830.1 hypothetical protein DMI72_00575 [Akkermansia muciniphila]QHV57208.1 hypothetical protein DMI73_00580 [Akkermansia muciniphila]QHV60570.1 hypothetical protein DMI74_06280 [Akkermansia muciniphila]